MFFEFVRTANALAAVVATCIDLVHVVVVIDIFVVVFEAFIIILDIVMIPDVIVDENSRASILNGVSICSRTSRQSIDLPRSGRFSLYTWP